PAPDFDTYRLGPGDAFFVNVRQFPDLSFQATLDIQGNVVVPLQGVVTFSGLTLQETATRIAQIYDQYVVNPDVSVTLIAQRGVEVTILGEVVRPGYYPLGAPQIAAALLTAGGTTGEADLREVMIQRRLADGQLLERTVDLFTPLQAGEELPDVALQDGDVIVVERLDPGELDAYDRDLVARSTLAKPTITVRFLNYGSGSLGGATSGSLTALDLPNGSRFADALVRASLNPDTSNLQQVALIRFDQEAGRAVTTTLNGNSAFRGEPSDNPPLQDNDVIIVNRTVLAKITYALSTFTQPFRDVLGFLLFFDQLAESADNLFVP
ncbi:MAG TPA: polysaccharide biosynthesis/export family protein, partial [Candidatus Obscuribacterales bacterium]